MTTECRDKGLSTLNLDFYRANVKPAVKYHVEQHPRMDDLERMAILSPSNECHICAMYHYLAEVKGFWSKECLERYRKLCVFHNIGTVVGVELPTMTQEGLADG